jgi:hypothetical protein
LEKLKKRAKDSRQWATETGGKDGPSVEKVKEARKRIREKLSKEEKVK